MGQVPRAKTWLLVGDGHLASHLSFYLGQLDVPCVRWSRRGPPAEPASGWVQDLDSGLSGSDRVLLALRDDALAHFVARHGGRDSKRWIHFSGSRRVPGARRAHPLCTFGPGLYDPGFYPTIPFVLDRGEGTLEDLLPGLPNPSVEIPAADVPLYHALCVSAGNFTTILWQRFFAELSERWGIRRELALPYLERTVRNLADGDGRDVLTGPLARGDAGTILENQAALEAAGLDGLSAVYASFARHFARPAPGRAS
jgi:hypothetical protein